MASASHCLRRLGAPALATVTAVTLVAVLAPAPALAADPIELGTAANFSVLADEAVTNTDTDLNPTFLEQDLGLDPGTAATGFDDTDPDRVGGEIHVNDDEAEAAQADLEAAYLQAVNEPVDGTLPADLNGMTITPGTYSSGTFLITGDVTLDAQGDNQSVFIFKAGTSLDTAVGSSFTFVNGASPCNVFWQVGTSATLGETSSFIGTVMANVSITAGGGAEINGRLLALSGAVTVETNTITEPICAAAPSPAPPGPNPPGPNPPGPDDPTLPVTGDRAPILTAAGGALVLLGGLLVTFYYRRRLNRYPF
jgi:LPXTG-motif cell wall-anchored protein